MKSPLLLLFPVATTLLPLALVGCAKSPSGGASVGRVLNRLQATLTVQDTIDQNAYYAVAFDDVPGDGTGPGGIEGNTPILNGIVGGNFRVAVVYHLNQFEVYYRSDPTDPGTEQRVLTSTDPIFALTPRATSNGITFTLNLDSRLNNTTYFFPRKSATGTTATPTPTDTTTPTATASATETPTPAPTATPSGSTQLDLDRIDLNFVTSNVIIRDGNDNRIKPVDANGFQTISSSTAVTNFQTNTSRNTSITDPSDDERPGVDPSFSGYNFGSIDVTSLQINLSRSTT